MIKLNYNLRERVGSIIEKILSITIIGDFCDGEPYHKLRDKNDVLKRKYRKLERENRYMTSSSTLKCAVSMM